MVTVPVTEFRLPNGARHHHNFPVSDELKEHVAALLDAGARFEVERLTTGQVSAEILVLDEEGDARTLEHMVLGRFGPPELERMIRNARLALVSRPTPSHLPLAGDVSATD